MFYAIIEESDRVLVMSFHSEQARFEFMCRPGNDNVKEVTESNQYVQKALRAKMNLPAVVSK